MEIFISYASHDRPVVQELVADLKDMGHNVWFDQDLAGGQKWWDNILAHIRDCDLFVCAITQHSIHSHPCKLEYTYAENLNKQLLPVVLEENVTISLLPVMLQERQIINYIARDKGEFKQLSNAIRNLPPAQSLPDPLPDPPTMPVSPLAVLQSEIDKPDLTYEQQLITYHKLKNHLKDPELGSDARKLLEKLAEHPSILGSILKDINESLQSGSVTKLQASSIAKSSEHLVGELKKFAGDLLQNESEIDTENKIFQLNPGEKVEAEEQAYLLRGLWQAGKLTITNHRLLFKFSALAPTTDHKPVEIPLQSITELQKSWKMLNPALAVQTSSGDEYFFSISKGIWYGDRDELITMIKGLMSKQ